MLPVPSAQLAGTVREVTFQQLYSAADESRGDPARRLREEGGLPCVGLIPWFTFSWSTARAPSPGQAAGSAPRGWTPRPASGTRAWAQQPLDRAPWQLPALPFPKRAVLTGERLQPQGAAKRQDAGPLGRGGEGGKATDRDVRGRVQRGSLTTCGENRLGRQERRRRDKCVCSWPGSGSWVRRRSRPGQRGSRVGSSSSAESCPSPRVCDRFLAHLVKGRSSWSRERAPSTSSAQGGAGGEEPWRGRQPGSTAGGGSISLWQTGRERRPGLGMCFGRTSAGGWGWERRGCWESEELMRGIQFPCDRRAR